MVTIYYMEYVERALYFMELEILNSSLRSYPNKLCDFGKDFALFYFTLFFEEEMILPS